MLLRPEVAALDPLAAAGKKVYGDQSCDACHGENGVGTDAGPKLAGATAQKPAAGIRNCCDIPTPR